MHGGHGLAGASFCIRPRRESIPLWGGILQRKITFGGMANSRGQISKNWHVCTPISVLCAKTGVYLLKNEADNRFFTVVSPHFEVGLIRETSNQKADTACWSGHYYEDLCEIWSGFDQIWLNYGVVRSESLSHPEAQQQALQWKAFSLRNFLTWSKVIEYTPDFAEILTIVSKSTCSVSFLIAFLLN